MPSYTHTYIYIYILPDIVGFDGVVCFGGFGGVQGLGFRASGGSGFVHVGPLGCRGFSSEGRFFASGEALTCHSLGFRV